MIDQGAAQLSAQLFVNQSEIFLPAMGSIVFGGSAQLPAEIRFAVLPTEVRRVTLPPENRVTVLPREDRTVVP
jgi:hypothetical protein